MAAATFINSTINSTSGPASRVVTPHASTLEGDLLIVVAEAASGTATLTAPGDWTTIKAFFATGTLGQAVFAKRRAAGDTTYTFPIAVSAFSQHLCMTIRGWEGNPANLIIGTTGTRAGSGGGALTIAPSITTVGTDNLVLCIGTDRTTATETGITSVDNGFTQLLWQGHAAGGSETIWVGTKVLAAAGAVGATTITYPNAQASNSMAFLLGIRPGVVAPVVGFAWTSGVEETALRAAWSIANATSIRMVVSQDVGLVFEAKYSAAVTVPANGWVTARVTGLLPDYPYYIGIEADGVLLAGGRLSGRTMGAHPYGLTFITGSCQYTGSNHAVFDQMRAENAQFFIHQGDLHYADTSDETTWRNALVSSLTAPKFAQLLSTITMPYTWDNHDYAGQGQEANDWDEVNNPQKFIRELMGEFPAAGEIYKTWVSGPVRFIQTDQWSERSPDEDPESSTKRCMTQAQEDWLYATLEAATEKLIIWATLWPLYRSVPGGRWGSYTTQRDRIKAWLAARPAIRAKLVGIGGDSHSVSADTGVNQDALGLIPTLNASPLNQTGGLPSGTWDIVNFDTVDADGYYSLVTITASPGNPITLLWQAKNQAGAVIGSWTKTWTDAPTVLACTVVGDAGATTPGHLYVYNGTTTVPVLSAQVAP